MSALPKPTQGPEIRDEPIPIDQPWPEFIEQLVLLTQPAHHEISVSSRLSRQEEVALDRYLASGVDIDDPCVQDGAMSPLFLAISKHCLPMVNALLERGAGVRMRTFRMPSTSVWLECSALTWALGRYDRKNPNAHAITESLLAIPATLAPEEVNAPNVSLQTPLAICIRARHPEVRDALVAHGANPHCRNKFGSTLLHQLASSMNNKTLNPEEELSWLNWALDHGVPIDTLDLNGETAHDIIRKKKNLPNSFLAMFDRALLERTTAPPPLSCKPSHRRI